MSDPDVMQIEPLDAEGVQFDWHAVAIRLLDDPEEPWHIFLTHGDTEMWLTTTETLVQPKRAELGENSIGEVRLAKLVEYLGCTWDELEADPFEVISLQCQALDALDETVMARLDATPWDEMRVWREETSQVTDGEALLSRLTGVDPRALRN